MKFLRRSIIAKTVGLYAGISVLWILASDSLLSLVVKDPAAFSRLSIFKGWFFIGVTSFLLAGLLRGELHKLKDAQEKLENNEAYYRSLFEEAPVCYQAVTETGSILRVNRTWCDTLGYVPEEIVGTPFDTYIADSVKTEKYVWLENLKIPGKLQHFEMTLIKKDGNYIQVQMNSRVSNNPDGTFNRAHCVFQDVTEVKQAQQNIYLKEIEYRQIFNSVNNPIFYVNSQGEILRTNKAGALLFGKSVDEMVGFDIGASVLFQGIDHNAENLKIIESQHPILGQIFNYMNSNGDPEWLQVNKFPYIDQNGDAVGVVYICYDFTDRFLHERSLQVLLDLSAKLRSQFSIKEVGTIVVTHLLENMHIEGCSLALKNEQENHLIVQEAGGIWKDSCSRIIQPGVGLSGQVFETGLPIFSNSVQEHAEQESSSGFQDTNALAFVPLITENHILGILGIGGVNKIREQDFRLLEAVSSIVSGAIHRVNLLEQTNFRMRRINALHDIDSAISSSFDWHVTLNFLISQVISLLGVDAACILKLDSETQILTYAAGDGFFTNVIQKTRLRLGESLAGRVALRREIQPELDIRSIDEIGFATFLESGEGFTSYVAAPLICKGLVKGVLELFSRARINKDPEWEEFLINVSTQAAIAIDNAELFESLQITNNELLQANDSIILGWSKALELRNKETHEHGARVLDLTLRLARKLGFPESAMPNLRRGVLLHDIGKMGVPDSVLLKPGKLDESDWVEMKKHPIYAYELLSGNPALKEALEVPYCHHERWDGSGYPRGLKREEIPFSARIFMVVDIWDAVTNDRVYRKKWTRKEAKDYLLQEGNVTLDPLIVAAFVDIVEEMEQNGEFTLEE